MNELDKAFDQLWSAVHRLKGPCTRAPMHQQRDPVLAGLVEIRAASEAIRKAAMKLERAA